MIDCKKCKLVDACEMSENLGYMNGGCRAYEERKSLTNYDKLIRYTPKELADFMAETGQGCPPGEEVSELCHDSDGGSLPYICNMCWLEWLKEEVET